MHIDVYDDVRVDYEPPIDRIFGEIFDEVDPRINAERFPSRTQVQRPTILLVRFDDKRLTPREALAYLRNITYEGLQPHAAAQFFKEYPYLGMREPLIPLGSLCWSNDDKNGLMIELWSDGSVKKAKLIEADRTPARYSAFLVHDTRA